MASIEIQLGKVMRLTLPHIEWPSIKHTITSKLCKAAPSYIADCNISWESMYHESSDRFFKCNWSDN